MNPTEEIVAPDAATLNEAPVAEAQPEIATPETEAEQPPQESDEDKTVKRMERRIQRLTAAKYQTLAEAQQAKQETEQLRQRLAQYEEAPQKSQEIDPIALATQIAEVRAFTEKSNKVAEDGGKKFPDFRDKLTVVLEEAGPLVAPIQPGASIGRPTPLGEAILDSDDPAALLHYLGSHPDVASTLHGLSPIQLAKKVARIEIEMQAPKEPKQSTAPKPVTPVKASSRVGNELGDELSPEEFRRRFLEQRAQRYR